MAQIHFQKWLETLNESLTDHVKTKLDSYVDADTVTNTTDFYEVRFGFPTDKEQRDMLPLKKPMIHFEIDNIEEVRIGLGDHVVHEDYNSGTGILTRYEAHCHLVNLDVGIWSGEDSGGELAIRRARQRLDLLFYGPTAKNALYSAVGAEINSWSGGRFVRDYINEQVVYRAADMELILRIYSYHAVETAQAIEGATQNPVLFIDNNVEIHS